jgi:hypothetical protein
MTFLKNVFRTGLLFSFYVLAHSPAWSAADALAADMKARLEKAYPNITVEIKPADDQLQLLNQGKMVAAANLINLREICQNRPQNDCEKQKQLFVAAVGDALNNTKSDAFSTQNLRLIVRPADYQQTIGPNFLFRPLGKHFIVGWAQDTASSMSPVSVAEMKASGLSTAELDKISAANLVREKTDPLKQPASKDYPGVFSTQGNDYLPSVLADEPFWKRVAGPYADEKVAICLPRRNQLAVYVPRLDPAKVVDFTRLCQNLAHSATPTFSNVAVWRINGKWQLD